MKNCNIIKLKPLCSIFAASVLVFCISACSKDDSIKIDEISFANSQEYLVVGDTVSLNVSVVPAEAAGRQITLKSSDEQVVKIEDGKAIALSSGTSTVTASAAGGSKTAVCNVSVGDIYFAGEDYASNYYSSSGVAAIWKNGKETILRDNYSSSSVDELISSAFVSDGDAYVLYTFNYLWKNGSITTINEKGWYDDRLDDIYVSGGTVYIAGSSTLSGPKCATLWKDGVPQFFKEGVVAKSVYGYGSDIYVAGNEDTSYGIETCRVILWKNGNASYLSEEGERNVVYSVFANEGGVYVVGAEYMADSKTAAKIWVDGAEEKLFVDETSSCIATDVWALDEDVYVAGYYFIDYEKCHPVVWKNGTPLELPAVDDVIAYSLCTYGDKLYVIGMANGFYDVYSYLWVIDTKKFEVIKTTKYYNAFFKVVTVK